jgi:hypothetical protein
VNETYKANMDEVQPVPRLRPGQDWVGMTVRFLIESQQHLG